MGGYGALLLAERLAVARSAPQLMINSGAAGQPAAAGPIPAVAAVAAMSPAIFATYSDAFAANKSAFDTPADFARNDVFAGISALRHVPTWVACGVDDPFQPQAALFRARLTALIRRPISGGITGGCHDDAFWLRNMPAALHFIGAHLQGR
jgi:S-formylglutathione hydrolase FrmB